MKSTSKLKIKKKLFFKISFYTIFTFIILVEVFALAKIFSDKSLSPLKYAQSLKYSTPFDFLTPTPTPIVPTDNITPTSSNSQPPTENTTPTSSNPQPPTKNTTPTPPNTTPEPLPTPNSNNEIRYPGKQYEFTYYYQCNSLIRNLSLPDGCNFCQASCGPTTVAMILSSFIDKKWDPVAVAELYRNLKQSGDYEGYLGCQGSYINGARKVLNKFLKTTDYIFANNRGYRAEQVVDDIKTMLDNGYYVFALVRFAAGGHFIWIVDVDEYGNIWAYDSYYGYDRYIPLNENNYYPYPYYRIAFGFKKL